MAYQGEIKHTCHRYKNKISSPAFSQKLTSNSKLNPEIANISSRIGMKASVTLLEYSTPKSQSVLSYRQMSVRATAELRMLAMPAAVAGAVAQSA